MRLHPLAVGGVLLALVSMCDGSAYARVDAPAVASAQAQRMSDYAAFDMPPIVVPDLEPVGLHGLPLPPPELRGCDLMNFVRVQAGLPYQFSDQPRTGLRSQWGYGWRESNCRNDVVSSTGCCVGFWQIHTGNFTAPGYRAGIAACEVSRRSDILGNDPIVMQKQACVAKVLYDVSGLTPWRL